MQEDQVNKNLKGMDDLDFIGWNNADWHGVFAHHHTDDVLVDWKGQEPNHGIEEHIDERAGDLRPHAPESVARCVHDWVPRQQVDEQRRERPILRTQFFGDLDGSPGITGAKLRRQMDE